MSKISIIKGADRKENIKKSIKLIENDIEQAIIKKNQKKLFIKINTVDINFPLACTHTDALEAVLDMFYNKFNEIIVGDNSFAFTKRERSPYKTILNKFPRVKLSDLTEFNSEDIKFKTINGVDIGKVSLLPKEAFTISLALPKTHDTFVYTGCLKNMFGCVIKNRGSLHALKLYERVFLNKYVSSNEIKWDNLINVIKKTKPDLCILDAYEGMENEGPILGTKIHLGIAMCSLDGIALDILASKICGLENVPYLSYLSGNSNAPELVKRGFRDIKEISKKFKPHYRNKYQIKTSMNQLVPVIDIKFAISVLKRSYRIKDKIIEKIKG